LVPPPITVARQATDTKEPTKYDSDPVPQTKVDEPAVDDLGVDTKVCPVLVADTKAVEEKLQAAQANPQRKDRRAKTMGQQKQEGKANYLKTNTNDGGGMRRPSVNAFAAAPALSAHVGDNHHGTDVPHAPYSANNDGHKKGNTLLLVDSHDNDNSTEIAPKRSQRQTCVAPVKPYGKADKPMVAAPYQASKKSQFIKSCENDDDDEPNEQKSLVRKTLSIDSTPAFGKQKDSKVESKQGVGSKLREDCGIQLGGPVEAQSVYISNEESEAVYADPAVAGDEETALAEAQADAHAVSHYSSNNSKHSGIGLIHELDQNELKVERELFLSMLRSEYWAQMEAGRLPENSMAAKRLLSSVDAAADSMNLQECLMDWEELERKLVAKPGIVAWFPFFMQEMVLSILSWWRWLQDLPARGVGFKVYVPVAKTGVFFDVFNLVCLVDAHLSTQQKLTTGGVLGRVTEARMRVLVESHAEVEQVWGFLDDHCTEHHIMEVRSKQLAMCLLTHEKSMVDG